MSLLTYLKSWFVAQSTDSKSPHPVSQNAHGSLSRNDLCPCGSGKKYKKCHLRAVEAEGAGVAFAEQIRQAKSEKNADFIALIANLPSGVVTAGSDIGELALGNEGLENAPEIMSNLKKLLK